MLSSYGVERLDNANFYIGAGSAGSSAAYYLSQYLANHTSSSLPPLNITIFERSEHIGGRSATVPVFGNISQPVELGASIFVSVNHNLVHAINTFNLSTTDDDEDGDDGRQVLGIWNGKEFVYTQDLVAGRWKSWWNTAKLFYRYGLMEPYRTRNAVQETVRRFLQMYKDPIFPFRSLTDAVSAVDLASVVGVTGAEHLKKAGVTGLFAQELIQASTRVNYAQDLANIHGVEAMVCMATNGAMAVKGGNWQMFAEMIMASGAGVLLNTTVISINKTSEGRHGLRWKSQMLEGESVDEFDAVILAAPYHQTNIQFTPALTNSPAKHDYVNLYTTLFSTPYTLSPTYFKLPVTARIPDMVLTTLPPADEHANHKRNTGLEPDSIFSISQVRTAINPATRARERVYKIFSSAPISHQQLLSFINIASTTALNTTEELPEAVSWHHEKLWQSYPYLPPVTGGFDDIRLVGDEIGTPGRGVWYTSGIEQLISTMETSSLMGMDVARLVVDELIELERKKEL